MPRSRAPILRILTLAAAAVLAAANHGRLTSALTAGPSAAQERWAFVRRVVDGDTVVLDTGEPVRYIGMNTPELHHHRKRVEPYGLEAKEANRRLVDGKKIRLEFDEELRDKYNRLLAYIYLEDGTFVNAELVRQGYARTMTIPPNVRYAELFRRLQQEAREAKRGLWALR